MTGAVLQVDIHRLLADFDALRARVAPAQCMLVVKNDAYGHGIDHVAGVRCRARGRVVRRFRRAQGAGQGGRRRRCAHLLVGDGGSR